MAFAQDRSTEIDKASTSRLYQKAAQLYAEGKYESVVSELTDIEKKLSSTSAPNKSDLGFIAYWLGLTNSRLQEFPEAILQFNKALVLEYSPQDLNYEYGQALYAMERYSEARIQFKESLKKKFKRGVSLYYIAYLSKELGDKKKAVTFFKAVDRLGPEEAGEVKQASEMIIGDIYLEQVEKHPDAFRAVETYVIPQYQKAFEVDEKSKLASVIKEKIIELQRKYDLVLFKMRNGRPTLIPPYFLRVALEVGQDSNVTFSPTETTVSKSKQNSIYSKNDVFGRYTFYHKNYLSIAPELRFNYTRYYNRVAEIYRNDNYLVAPAIRSAYEHDWRGKAASVLFDYDFSQSQRDVEANKKLQFSSRSHTFMLGERINYFQSGETIVRLRHRVFDSYQDDNDGTTSSLVFEQIKTMGINTLIFYFSYDRLRNENEIYNTNSVSLRTDYIMARFRDWFTPSIGLGLTSTDPINARSTRGRELLINPNARLSKTIGKNWRANLKYDYQQNNSKDKSNFAFKKHTYSFELEYLF